MSDIIKLLPDAVANQIAAGEVIQRPASAVKELVENAIDAGSTKVQISIKDAGRTLIQVIDNGYGMSETDARMSFERHATSKITEAKELFSLTTKGFRGEALASIAAVSQVELKAREEGQEVGTQIFIDGSEVKKQAPIACPVGTSIAIRSLFFNVPARRNFLKSDPVELRHIIEEFHRIALAHHNVAFIFRHNDNTLFDLPQSNLRQRIINVFGDKFNERLVPLEESTPVLTINGFIGKPEFSRKTRGEQFFFVNNRFIKSPYLNHAVNKAYKDLVNSDSYPAYFIYISIDPSEIDINIHPTKTEIKFRDEKLVYAVLNSSVKRSLGRFNLTPSIDFERETSFDFPDRPKTDRVEPPKININPDYNPFHGSGGGSGSSGSGIRSGHSEAFRKMRELYEQTDETATEIGIRETENASSGANTFFSNDTDNSTHEASCLQLHNKYIVTSIRSGMVLINQQRAHERVLYEHYIATMAHNAGTTQQELFPETLRFSGADAELLRSILPSFRKLGFDIEEIGSQGFVINGTPVNSDQAPPKELVEKLLEYYKLHQGQNELKPEDRAARSLASALAIKPGQKLQLAEMQNLIDGLFGCETPAFSPSGKATIISFTLDDIDDKFD